LISQFRTICILLVLALLTGAVFWGITGNEFINYDDNQYILANRHVSSGLTTANVEWAFTTFHASNWHPLTWLSHMADVELFGLNPHGHHFMGLVFHTINTSLLFLLLVRLTGAAWRSAMVAALFALHPLHVESVAWAAERKDLLSTCFGFLSLLFYAGYGKQKQMKRYIGALICFALGLLAKPMLVTLPLLFLLLDYWPLGRFGDGIMEHEQDQLRVKEPCLRLLWEKAPFFALAVLSCVITLYAQRRGGAVASLADHPLSYRFANALVAYCGYLGKTFWPHDLAVLYPLPPNVPLWQSVGAGALLLTITVLALAVRRRQPYFIVGWLWFIGTLVPVIGLVQVGLQAMADRYTYVPIIGIFVVLVWGVAGIAENWPYRRAVLASAALIVVVTCCVLSWHQVRFWKDSVTLFTHALAVTNDNPIAHNNLGIALDGKGKVMEGIAHFSESVRIDPLFSDGYFNMGAALARQGNVSAAVSCYAKALQLQPGFADVHVNLGIILASQGKLSEALDHFAQALKFKPESSEAHYNLALALEMQGRADEAIKQYLEALRLDPEHAESHNNLGVALLRQEKYDAAMRHFSQALRLRPDFADARQNLALLVKQKAGMPGRGENVERNWR
jgi:tetratricopeptide (TPR) repeat protein